MISEKNPFYKLIYQKDNILNPHFIVKGNK